MKNILKNKLHSHGTYIHIKYNENDLYQLSKLYNSESHTWLKTIPLEDLHTTIIHSNVGNKSSESESKEVDFEVEVHGFELLGKENEFIVASVHSKELRDMQSELTEKYNFVSDFPEYKPHITVGKISTGSEQYISVPVPIVLRATRIVVEPLNPDFKY